jgi:hypothetical protein
VEKKAARLLYSLQQDRVCDIRGQIPTASSCAETQLRMAWEVLPWRKILRVVTCTRGLPKRMYRNPSRVQKITGK